MEQANLAPSSTPARITAKQKQNQALQLRTGGATYGQIADTLGLGSPASAHKLVKKALDAIPHEAAAELRQVELQRMEELEMRLRARLRAGDVSVAGNLLRLSDQRAKLTGIYMIPETAGDLSSVQNVFAGFLAGAAEFAAQQEALAAAGDVSVGEVLTVQENAA